MLPTDLDHVQVLLVGGGPVAIRELGQGQSLPELIGRSQVVETMAAAAESTKCFRPWSCNPFLFLFFGVHCLPVDVGSAMAVLGIVWESFVREMMFSLLGVIMEMRKNSD